MLKSYNLLCSLLSEKDTVTHRKGGFRVFVSPVDTFLVVSLDWYQQDFTKSVPQSILVVVEGLQVTVPSGNGGKDLSS